MTSWIYILSKFTPEALLFEALLICVLVSSYAAFWVLRKRRFGAVENEVPSSVVKVYLNELIGEAEDMRAQLFGLLSGGSRRPHHADGIAAGAGPSHAFVVSGDAAEKLAALERKMAEQAAAMEKIMGEKTKLEKELSDARASSGGASESAADSASAGGEDLQKLQEKCQSLEARLAEYSVIEDDLANLKRLQQENAQLKTQLAGGAGATAAGPAVAAPVAAPAPSAAPDAPAPSAPQAAAPAAAAPGADPMSQDGIQAALDVATGDTAGAANATNAFEGLVDEVEKSLQPDAPTAAPAAAAPAVAETKTEKTPEKTDDDLIAEFEKMLNS